MVIENLSRVRCRNGAGRVLRAAASVIVAAASLVAPVAAYGATPEKAGQNITFSIPTSLRCAVRADGTVVAPSGWSMSNSGSGKVEITGVSVSNAIGKLRLSGKSGSVGYAVGEGSGSYAVSYDAAGGCRFSSTSDRPLGIESGKSLSWSWDIGKLDASDHRTALDAAASGRARLCDMSFSYAPVGSSLSSAGTTCSMSGAVDSHSSSVVPVGGTATANVSNASSNATLSYQWYTVDSNGSYSAIANANGKTLKVLAAYKGKDIVCRVSDSSGHYSGYVETARKPVRNLVPTVGISGSPVYGGKLTAATSGLPSGATYTYKYRWQRLSGSSWADIANATVVEYTLGGEDVGKQVRVIVSTASNIYTVDDASAVSATVAKAKASIGVSISGTKNNSSRLTASVSGLPAAGANTVSYRWQRSSDGKSNWSDSTAGDAKSNSIQMQPNDVSWHYRCIVSASNPYYDIASATSAAYGPIAKSTVSAAKATISGNAVYGGTIKANVTNVPAVGTNSISYQWQYSNDGKTWNDTRLNGGNPSSLVLSAVSCVGTQYRCVVSVDSSYYIVPGCTTAGVKIGKASAQAVAKASGEAVAGKKLTAAVSGLPTVGGTNKVSYQWQSSRDGKTWGSSSLTGAKTATLCLYDDDDVAHSMIGYSFRCVVSVDGNSAYDIKSATSNVIGPVAKGTASAPSVSVSGTKKIESTLKATVTGLPKYGNSKVSYQWQTSADGSTWADSTQSDAKSVSFKPAYSLVNQYVRCAVSVFNGQYDVAMGYSAAYGKLGKASKTISASITSPNKRNGDILTCGISGLASNGSNTISYKWEYATDSAFKINVSAFNHGGNTHPTETGTGGYYRCTVTVSNPYYEYNTAVSPVYGPLAKGVASAPTVTVSGSNAWGSTLKATVTGLPKYGTNKISYQWEARDDSSTTWGNSGYATATTDHITVDAQDAVSKSRHYRCKVTVDNDQYTVPVAYSADHGKTVKASATAKAAVSGTAAVGGKLTCSVSGLPTSGSNAVSYQWQSSKDGKSWTNSTTGNTKALSTGDLGLHYRCHVSATNPYYTIASGYTAASAAVGKGTVNASVSVSGTKSVGSKLTANVSGLPGTGTNTVAYKWQWSKDGSTGWTDSGYTDAKASSIVMHAEDIGYYYRCVITVSGNAYYNVNGATSAAYGPMGKGSHAAPTVSISGTKAYGYTLTANVSGQPAGTTGTTYQWQRNSGSNGAWANISNATGKTYVLTGSDLNHSIRVLVNTSNTYYNVSQGVSTAYGTIGKAGKTISASVSGTKSNTSKLTVSVSGLPTVGTNTVSYQWQWSKDGFTGWTNSTYGDGKSNTIQMKEADVAYYYRCVVSVSGNAYYNVTGATTAAYGPMAKSSHGAPTVSVSGSKTYGSTLTANVSGQPIGTTGTSYQWQRASSSTGTWSNITSATGKTYKIGTGDMNQYLRVLVGTTSTYYTVSQGVSAGYGPIGKATASISATVSGSKVIESAITANVTGLPSVGTNTVSYQWQYSSDNKTWTNSAQTDAKTKTITPNHTWAGVYARCVISVSGNAYYNINGYTLNVGQIGKGTKTVSVSLTGNAAVGGSLKANVSGLPANGTNTVAYQWQYSSDNETWSNSTAGDAKTATHALNYKEAYNLYWRCTVSVSGNQYYNVHGATSASKLCGKGTASITASVSGSAVIGGKLTCSVGGLPSIGTNSVSYKWQYSADGSTWADSNNSGAKTNSISLPPDGTLGKRFRCVVTATNSVYNNMSATSAATAAVGKGTATASVSVSGSKVYGATLTANPSQPIGTTGTSYQWQRNTGTNGAWVNISNATGKTYKLGTADVGHSVRVLVNTANTYYNVSQCASAAAVIGKASATATATVSGTKTIGSKLTVSVGGLPSIGTNTIAYKWQYSSDNKTWTDSKSTGATSNVLTTDTSWLNKYARCVITVSGNAYYNVNGATSTSYGPIGKANYSAPSVSIGGSKVYGATLTANVSGLPNGTTGITYQWQRANSASGSYSNIASATGKTYVAAAGDMGKYLRVLVNTAHIYYNVSQGVSAGYGPIGKASHSAPSVSVSGDKSVGSTLTASVSGQPSGTTSTTYQWQRASSASGSYSNISGATGKTYKTVDADANKYVRVLVNTANTYYTVSQGVSAGYGAITLHLNPEAFAVYSESDASLNFYKKTSVPKVGDMFNGRRVTDVFTGIENNKYIYIHHPQFGKDEVPWSKYRNKITNVKVIDSISPISMDGWFSSSLMPNASGAPIGMNATIKTVDMSKIDLSRCTSMEYCFGYNGAITTITFPADTNSSSLTRISGMFNNCTNLTEINHLDCIARSTYNVSDMSYLFCYCSALTSLDLSGWDTSNVTNMRDMFRSCYKLQEITFGKNWKWIGTNGYLPTPDSQYIPGANGKWYAKSDGAAYAPAGIPSNKADTYYAKEANNFLAETDITYNAFLILGNVVQNFISIKNIPCNGKNYSGTYSLYLYNANTKSTTTLKTETFSSDKSEMKFQFGIHMSDYFSMMTPGNQIYADIQLRGVMGVEKLVFNTKKFTFVEDDLEALKKSETAPSGSRPPIYCSRYLVKHAWE